MERRSFLRCVLAWSAMAVCAARPAPARAGLAVATALNLSGRQRMLAQRLAKAWAMRGLGILPARAGAILEESLALQRNQLVELAAFVPSEAVRTALGSLEREWGPYRAALAAPSLPARAQAVYDLSEQVQDRAHRLTLAYEQASRVPAMDRLVNIGGRQRMLSQRLAKFYLFGAWGVNPPAAQMEVDFARAEFSSGMTQLRNAVGEAAALRATLEEFDRAWIGYRDLFVTGPAGRFPRRSAERIAGASERLLPVAERLVALLEQQAQLHSP